MSNMGLERHLRGLGLGLPLLLTGGPERALRWTLREGLTSPLFAPAMRLGQAVRPLLHALTELRAALNQAGGGQRGAGLPRGLGDHRGRRDQAEDLFAVDHRKGRARMALEKLLHQLFDGDRTLHAQRFGPHEARHRLAGQGAAHQGLAQALGVARVLARKAAILAPSAQCPPAVRDGSARGARTGTLTDLPARVETLLTEAEAALLAVRDMLRRP